MEEKELCSFLREKLILAKSKIMIKQHDETVTPAGILIPATAARKKEGGMWGTIVATHEDSREYPIIYPVGTRVVYSQYSGSEVELPMLCGKPGFLIMNDDDIWLAERGGNGYENI